MCTGVLQLLEGNVDIAPFFVFDGFLKVLHVVVIEESADVLEVGEFIEQLLRHHVGVLIDEVLHQIRAHHVHDLSH